MTVRSRYELERAAEACYRDLRKYDFLQTYTDASLLGFARWAIGCSLNAQQLIRLVWGLGCQEIGEHGEQIAAIVGSVNGAPMTTLGMASNDVE